MSSSDYAVSSSNYTIEEHDDAHVDRPKATLTRRFSKHFAILASTSESAAEHQGSREAPMATQSACFGGLISPPTRVRRRVERGASLFQSSAGTVFPGEMPESTAFAFRSDTTSKNASVSRGCGRRPSPDRLAVAHNRTEDSKTSSSSAPLVTGSPTNVVHTLSGGPNPIGAQEDLLRAFGMDVKTMLAIRDPQRVVRSETFATGWETIHD
ncbi:hypothetical protein K458DRAFT_398653 [Lentithecium fluviatile CBS 122367]|uniref:Uncharacterized protein n=1 Tax=Lentithecium fluviatile CBS 122367 TaxID=1168545 RepID=A0A6G1JKH9_9PLEO|nr:hypothetical protein K458DRAFT_398653 [Lentithecium fluviatile CBS 122367]